MKQDVDAVLTAISSYIAESRQLLESGQSAELSSLTPLAEELQRATERLTPEQRTQAAADIARVMEELTALEEALRAAQDAILAELQNIGQLRRAHLAYQPKPTEE